MKSRRALRSIFATLPLAAMGHAFTLTGTVYERGTSVPLSGANVSIAGRAGIPAARSDASGAFLLTDQSTKIAGARSPMMVRWEAGTLVVREAGEAPVHLDILSLSGRRMAD